MPENVGYGQEAQGAMQQLAATLTQQAETAKMGAQALIDAGAPKEAADKLMQASELIMSSLADLGIEGGGEAPAAEKASAGMVAPETAGAQSARPVDMRG